jgi:catechol-2,3-dioxygenase
MVESIQARSRERFTMSEESTKIRKIGKNGGRSISPPRLSHIVLRTTHLKPMIDWYTTVFDAQVLYQNEMLAFLTYDDEHHRIALFAIPGTIEKPKHSAGLDHIAFFYPTIGDWIATYERLKALGITPHGGMHHGITISLYYRDPDQNGVELAIDGMPKSEWHHWMRNELGKNLLGAPLDPEDLARRYHAGEAETELLRFNPPAGGAGPETLRRLMD